MVRHAREYGGQIMCDMDGVKRPGRRPSEVDGLGVNYVSIASGYLMEHEYDLHKRNHGSIFQLQPLELAGAVKRNLIHAGLAIGTGVNLENIGEVMKLKPEIVMVGRGIFGTADENNVVDPLETRIATAHALKAAMGA